MRKILETNNLPKDPVLGPLLSAVDKGVKRLRVDGLTGSAKALLMAILFNHLSKTVVVVSPTEKEAQEIFRDLCFFLGEEPVFLYPPWSMLSTDMLSFEREEELQRIEPLCRLWLGKPFVFVLSEKALMQKVIPKGAFDDYVREISIGAYIDRDELVWELLAGGYHRTTLVEQKGEFSVRGNIIDLFVPTMEKPFRMEFVGDELESIREFSPSSQRSTKELAEFLLFPAGEAILSSGRKRLAVRNIRRRANELDLSRTLKDRLCDMVEDEPSLSINPLFLSLFYESYGDEEENNAGDRNLRREGQMLSDSGAAVGNEGALGALFDYLPQESLIVFDDDTAIRQAAENIESQMDRFLFRAADEEKFYPEKFRIYLTQEMIRGQSNFFQQVLLEDLRMGLGDDPGDQTTDTLHFHVSLDRDYSARPPAAVRGQEEGYLAPLAEKINGWIGEGDLVTFLCTGPEDISRMESLFGRYGLAVHFSETPFLSEIHKHDGSGRLVIREGRLGGGFRIPDLRLVVISEEEIFGKKVARKRIKTTREGYFLQSFGELKEGDYVVHTDHGIGRYRGLQKLSVAGIDNDFLLIEYSGRDRLYIPVDRLDRIQRYIGPEDYTPKVDKLGGPSWETAKERVKKSVREIAEELISIYAAREVMEGYTFSAPDRIYDEFCSTFEYEETPDQARAIEDIHVDMNSARPMDRLICGDAGFGKTEVALRASFRAAMDAKQVAVLVPTTILAEQHYKTFSERLKDYPVRVEVLNRFKTKLEQKEILDGVRRGMVDVVIGTHRILQKDVEFKDLGLVIIDEEQRFGVVHKEKLKKLRTLVDVMTLSATPIPRTLHLSLIGIRDLSIINTPPENRLPIKTHVLEFDEETIKGAIKHELNRGGQVFFLHDRVRSIYSVARFVNRLVPEAKVGVAHGRMKGKELEETMAKFIKGIYNVLVCTTIIGSGLDIPTANTIIINRADRFGLAQLYQIRGRVGRSKEEGFAYLLVPRGVMLSRDARKRLRVIMDFTEPGSGFRISSNDLEIRGAGNLLGASQSGHVSAVGYELYTELMEKTIREIKGEEIPPAEANPEIHLGLSAFIPQDYMPDEQGRLVTYKRLSLADDEEDLMEIKEELTDRYGFLPPEAETLLELISLRNLLKMLKGKRMEYDGKNMTIHFHQYSPLEPEKILKMAATKQKGLKLTPDFKLYVPMAGLQKNDIIDKARGLLFELIH
ncbi:MAG: transcription-repair coupling factor [Deltaproteobacteria bacterium]|nr:transcription-repair coupling factor [Deltaproteobacteria bacterium]